MNIQYRIFKCSLKGDLNKARFLQTLYFKSLLTRIRCVKNILGINNSNIFPSSKLTIHDKLTLISNLGHCLEFNSFNSFIVAKKKSLSFFFEDSKIFVSCLKCLYLESILPVIDFSSDRSFIFYRPYRCCQDVFLVIKNLLISKIKSPWILRMEFFFKSTDSSWFIKNFPFFRFNNNLLDEITLPFFGIKDRFSFILINFLLNGLVRHSQIYYRIYVLI